MPKLEVYLLGSPVARIDGVVSRFRTRKTLALLAILTVTPGAARRETLASLLWDDLEIEAARRELRKTLSYLGDGLGACASMLEVTRHTLELKRNELSSDVERLEIAIRGGEPTALEAVIQEYGGEFMLGFEAGGAAFAAWLLERREAARSALHQACEALFERRLTAHQLPEALEMASVWVRHEPASETAHRAVMRAQLAAGNPSAALSAFETCRAALARELEASPGAEARHLAEQARTALGLGAPPANLVGRADAWTKLEAATLGEGATLCLILGEPGMGKSRLALEFAASRHDPLLLRAEITSSLTPLAPVADALRSSLNDPARVARLNALPLAWRNEVARLVPEFGSSADAGVIPTHEGRSRLLEGLTHGLLAALGPHGMLVMDDLHRFDADSAALALGVLRRSPRAALATARAPELEANTEVCAVLEGFERHARLEKLALGALSPLEVTALIGDSGRDAEALHRFTGGNPLYVLEALRHPDAERATQGVLELVRRRVQRLGEPVQRLLEAASLSGEAFHLDGVQRASRLEEPEALGALERAVDAELILESAPGHRFSHALIRQALEDGLSAERKRRLHRHLAMDASESARIAEHLERGGRPLQAVPHRLRAAVEATRLHAYRLALAHQDAALEDGLDDAGFAGLFEARYRLFVALADWDGLERELQRFEDTAARLGQPDLIAFVEMGWTDFCFRVGRYAQGVERATRLLRQPLPPEVEAMTRYARGLSNLSLGHHEAAQRDCADALECAPDTWAMRGWALNTLAICQSARGLFDAALEVNAESEAWFRAVADRHGIASTQRVAAPILARQGQEARALNLLEGALRTARDLHHVFLERAVLETIVKVHLGRLEDAANAGVNEREDAFLEGVPLEQLERALPWMERCLELAREPRDAFLEPLWQARVARARWLLSSTDPRVSVFRVAYRERPSPSDG